LLVHKNWKKGRYSTKVLNGHKSEVNCVRFDEQKIISGSDDRTVKIWKRIDSSATEIATLCGHSRGVESLEYRDSKLFTGSSDTTLGQWDISQEYKIRAYLGHQSLVRCVKYVNSTLYSSSSDQLIKIWDENSGKEVHTLKGHTSEVFNFQLKENLLVSSSFDHSVKLWDLRKMSWFVSLQHSSPASAVQMNEELIVQGTSRGDILVRHRQGESSYSLFTAEQNHNSRYLFSWNGNTFGENFENAVWSLALDGSKLVAACGNNIQVLNVYSGKVILTVPTHRKTVWSIDIDTSTLVSASKDATIAIHHFGPHLDGSFQSSCIVS